MKMNLREKAIADLLEESKRSGDNARLMSATLPYLSDMNLFALYIDVFGHAVGEKAGDDSLLGLTCAAYRCSTPAQLWVTHADKTKSAVCLNHVEVLS